MVNRGRQIDKGVGFPPGFSLCNLCGPLCLCGDDRLFTTETQRTTEDAQRNLRVNAQSFSQLQLQPVHFTVIGFMIIS
jgi:hypothetical protein